VVARRARSGQDDIRAHRQGRRLALASIFEADFGQRTAEAVLERHLAASEGDQETAAFARRLVHETVADRVGIDRRIGQLAPQYPVVQLARIDRSLLRTAMGEVLHSPATPARVAISEWVELARIYSGDPARRLMNGVLGQLSREAGASSARSDDGSPDDAGSPAG
jgi:transcription antitermination protein NusB